MSRPCRLVLLAVALAALAVGVVLLGNLPGARSLWPLAANPLSRNYVGAVAISAALPIAWAALSGDAHAVRAGAIGVFTAFAPMAVYLFVMLEQENVRSAAIYVAIAATVLALGAAAAFQFVRAAPPQDARPTPTPVRALFGLLAVVLAFGAAALMLRYPIFSWQLGRNGAPIFGFAMAGLMIYLLDAWIHPTWSNARGQLLALLGFDLGYAIPVARLLQRIEQEVDATIVVFAAYVAITAVVAAYYLVVSKPWRLALPARASA